MNEIKHLIACITAVNYEITSVQDNLKRNNTEGSIEPLVFANAKLVEALQVINKLDTIWSSTALTTTDNGSADERQDTLLDKV